MSLKHSMDSGFNKKSGKKRKNIFLIKVLPAFIASLVVVVIAVFVYIYYTGQMPAEETAPVSSENSIAILPIKNIDGDKEGRIIADGINETLLNNLAQVSDLKVISRTSSEKYRTSEKSIHQIAEELEVSYILEGSVEKYENRIKINIQLIDTHQDQHLWAESFDVEFKDISDLCSEIAKQVELELKRKPFASVN